MATFKYMVRKGKMRADGTWNVVIRMTHERAVRYLPTSMYVTKADLTSAFKIKNIIRKTKRIGFPKRSVYFRKTKRIVGSTPFSQNFSTGFAGVVGII